MAEDKRYNINERIQALELRVVGAKGETLGVMSKFEALQKAREAKQDLVEIAPRADPPVAKIMDFKKFLYEERKRFSAIKARSKQVGLKEFKFGPNIGENDFNVRIQRARGFLSDHNRVKFTVNFSGRQMAFPQIGREKIERVVSELSDVGDKESEPRFVGRQLSVIILPK